MDPITILVLNFGLHAVSFMIFSKDFRDEVLGKKTKEGEETNN